jgi:hypothetical protein
MRMRPEDGMRSASNRTSPTPSFTRATVITLIIEVAFQRCRYGLSHQLFRLSALPSNTLWCPIKPSAGLYIDLFYGLYSKLE